MTIVAGTPVENTFAAYDRNDPPDDETNDAVKGCRRGGIQIARLDGKVDWSAFRQHDNLLTDLDLAQAPEHRRTIDVIEVAGEDTVPRITGAGRIPQPADLLRSGRRFDFAFLGDANFDNWRVDGDRSDFKPDGSRHWRE